MGYHRKGTQGGPRNPQAGIGKSNRKSGSFWAGALTGAALATGGYVAVRALERAFGKKKEEQLPVGNPPNMDEFRRKLIAAAGAPGALPPAKPPVVKRTVIEEMVEEMDAD
jgi:hypothetical protein